MSILNNEVYKYICNIKDILNNKRKFIREILKLTKSQATLIQQSEIEQLNDSIEKKQKFIDSINKLDRKFNNYIDNIKKILGVNHLNDIKIKGFKEIQLIIADITNLMEEISRIEINNKSKAEELYNSLGKEIRKINQTKKINTAYRPGYKKSPSYFMDRKK